MFTRYLGVAIAAVAYLLLLGETFALAQSKPEPRRSSFAGSDAGDGGLVAWESTENFIRVQKVTPDLALSPTLQQDLANSNGGIHPDVAYCGSSAGDDMYAVVWVSNDDIRLTLVSSGNPWNDGPHITVSNDFDDPERVFPAVSCNDRNSLPRTVGVVWTKTNPTTRFPVPGSGELDAYGEVRTRIFEFDAVTRVLTPTRVSHTTLSSPVFNGLHLAKAPDIIANPSFSGDFMIAYEQLVAESLQAGLGQPEYFSPVNSTIFVSGARTVVADMGPLIPTPLKNETFLDERTFTWGPNPFGNGPDYINYEVRDFIQLSALPYVRNLHVNFDSGAGNDGDDFFSIGMAYTSRKPETVGAFRVVTQSAEFRSIRKTDASRAAIGIPQVFNPKFEENGPPLRLRNFAFGTSVAAISDSVPGISGSQEVYACTYWENATALGASGPPLSHTFVEVDGTGSSVMSTGVIRLVNDYPGPVMWEENQETLRPVVFGGWAARNVSARIPWGSYGGGTTPPPNPNPAPDLKTILTGIFFGYDEQSGKVVILGDHLEWEAPFSSFGIRSGVLTTGD